MYSNTSPAQDIANSVNFPVNTFGPLRLTVAPWHNHAVQGRAETDRDGIREHAVKWTKVLSLTGEIAGYGYGTVTGSGPRGSRHAQCGPDQRAVICSPVSGVLVVDCDDPATFPAGLAALLTPNVRTARGWHAYVDMRGVPAAEWPSQGPIRGGDIKCAGFVPMPGSTHWTGAEYALLGDVITEASAELLMTLRTVRSEHKHAAGRIGSGHGDIETQQEPALFALACRLAARGVPEEDAWQEWLSAALAFPVKDPEWPWSDADRDVFGRHWAYAQSRESVDPKLVAFARNVSAGESNSWSNNDLIGSRVNDHATDRPIIPLTCDYSFAWLRAHCERTVDPVRIHRRLKAYRNSDPDSTDWQGAPDNALQAAERVLWAIAGTGGPVPADQFPDLAGQVRHWLTRNAPVLDIDGAGMVHALDVPKLERKSAVQRSNYPGCPDDADPAAGRTYGADADDLICLVIAANPGLRMAARDMAEWVNTHRADLGIAAYRYMSVEVARKARKRCIDDGRAHAARPARYYVRNFMWHSYPPVYALGPAPDREWRPVIAAPWMIEAAGDLTRKRERINA